MRKSSSSKATATRNAADQPNQRQSSGVSQQSPVQLMPVVQMFHPQKEHIGWMFQVKTQNGWVICTYKGVHENGQYLFVTNETNEPVYVDNESHDAIRPGFSLRSLPSSNSSSKQQVDKMELSSENDDDLIDSEHSEESLSGDEEVEDNYSGIRKINKEWTPQQKFQQIDTPFGVTNVKHNRKSAYITTNVKQYPKTKVKVDYKDIIRALRESKLSDAEIAEILLNGDNSKVNNNTFKRAAAMLSAIVYLAEQWRKQGAVKIYRALLRAIIDGYCTFDQFLKYFEFIVSAQAGREQVAKYQLFLSGVLPYKELKEHDKLILGNMSPYRQNDLDSDDDVREIKEDDFVNGRKSTKYWEKSKKNKLDAEDLMTIKGTTYNIIHPRIRSGGECFWDTLIYFGVDANALEQAAGDLFNQYIAPDQINGVLQNLAQNHNINLQIQLQAFTYSGIYDGNNSGLIGQSGPVLHIGLVFNPEDRQGHYIPALNK